MKEFLSKYGILFVALIALVQPWLLYGWKKIFRKANIDIFESGRMTIGYGTFGPSVELNGTLRCLNQDIFVSSIKLEIMKLKDKSIHSFDWGLFFSGKITYKAEEAEHELPYGIMLNTSQPRRYNILFHDTKTLNEMNNIIRKVDEEWKNILRKNLKSIVEDKQKFTELYNEEFSKSGTHVDAYSNLDRLCYWESGEYKLVMKVLTSKPNREFKKIWKFKLNEEDIKMIRINSVKILSDTCKIQSFALYNFAYAKYDEL